MAFGVGRDDVYALVGVGEVRGNAQRTELVGRRLAAGAALIVAGGALIGAYR